MPAARGYTHVPNALIEDAALPGDAFKLWCLLAKYARTNGYAWLSLARMAALTGHHPNSIRRHLAALVGAGLLRIEARTGQTSFYYPRDRSPNPEGHPSQLWEGLRAHPSPTPEGSPPTNGRGPLPKMGPKESVVKNHNEEGDPSAPLPASINPETPRSAYSPYILAVAQDLARELGDNAPTATAARALRLWAESGRTEEAFVTLLRETKATVRRCQAGGLRSKADYWMECVRRAAPPAEVA